MASPFADLRGVLLVVVALALPGSALAQSTGGRVGGFGGGSSGSSSYRPSTSRYGGTTTSTPGPSAAELRYQQEQRAISDANYRRWREARVERGSPEPTEAERAAIAPESFFGEDSLYNGLLAFALGFVGAFVVGGVGRSLFGRTFVMRRLSVGFGPEARAAVQAKLRALAAQGAATSQAREALVRETLALCRAHAAHARYAVWSVERHRGGPGRKRFHALAQDLRTRFKHETVGAGHATPALRARPEEGPGLVVVSLVVTGPPQRPLPATLDLAAALEHFDGRWPLGVELVWSPSEADDRMSSAELETLYPELARLGDDVGRVACGFCGAVHARELGACPACGAPAQARAVTRKTG